MAYFQENVRITFSYSISSTSGPFRLRKRFILKISWNLFRYVFAWNPTCHGILGRVHLRLMCSVDIFTVCFILVFNPTCHGILGRVHLRLTCSVDIFTVCFILVFNPTCHGILGRVHLRLDAGKSGCGVEPLLIGLNMRNYVKIQIDVIWWHQTLGTFETTKRDCHKIWRPLKLFFQGFHSKPKFKSEIIREN